MTKLENVLTDRYSCYVIVAIDIVAMLTMLTMVTMVTNQVLR